MKKVTWFLLIITVISGFYLMSCKEQAVSKSGDITDIAKEFLNLLIKEDFKTSVTCFDTTMKTALPENKLKEAWESLITKAGAFKKETSIKKDKEGSYDVVHITCEFEKTPVDMKIVFNNSKEISGLWFLPPEKEVKSDEVKSGEISDMAKEFFNLLLKEDFKTCTTYFDSTMKTALPENKLKGAWKSLIAQTGPYKSQKGMKKEKEAGFDVVIINCSFEKAPIDVKIVFNNKKEISGLWFLPGK
jgi:hypothetical protein